MLAIGLHSPNVVHAKNAERSIESANRSEMRHPTESEVV